jgi:hypothetical protein
MRGDGRPGFLQRAPCLLLATRIAGSVSPMERRTTTGARLMLGATLFSAAGRATAGLDVTEGRGGSPAATTRMRDDSTCATPPSGKRT